MEDKEKDYIFTKLEEIINLDNSLKEESDRGCAMLIVSYLDKELKTLLENRFLQNKNIIKDLMGVNRPLSSFSSRIDLAYLIGLIGCKMREDLHLIRGIRNGFAHDYTPITFDKNEIKSKCNQLYHSKLSDSIDTRTRFVKCCIHLLSLIQAESLRAIPFDQYEDLVIDDNLKELLTDSNKLIIDSIIKNKASH